MLQAFFKSADCDDGLDDDDGDDDDVGVVDDDGDMDDSSSGKDVDVAAEASDAEDDEEAGGVLGITLCCFRWIRINSANICTIGL